jgi:hypothetical protein
MYVGMPSLLRKRYAGVALETTISGGWRSVW